MSNAPEELKSSSITPKSMRIDDETLEKLKKITAENFSSQNQCLKALIQVYELEQSRLSLEGQRTDIDNFQAHLSAIADGYLHALRLNNESETRIRNELSLAITTRDKTITSLQDNIDKLKSQLESYKEMYREQKTLADQRLNDLVKNDSTIKDKSKLITNLEEKNSQLSEMVISMQEKQASYDQKIALIDSIEAEITALRARNEELESLLADARKEQAEKLAAAEAAAADAITKCQETALFEKEKALFALQTEYQDKMNLLQEKHLLQMQDIVQNYQQAKNNVEETLPR